MKNKDLILSEMEKRKEITNTFNKNYLLEAGAGAGKTTIIVERIINHIVNLDINPSNLVAITFTKAAATELAERIQIKALERLKIEKDPKIVGKLKNVDRIFTGTIHSFCDLILREMPFHADLSPGYEIVEDAEEFHTNIWYNFLRDRVDEYKDKIELLYKFDINYMDLRKKALLALENLDVNFLGYDGEDYSYEDLVKEFEDIKDKYGDLEYKEINQRKSIGKLLYPLLKEGQDLEEYLNKFNNAFEKDSFDEEGLFFEIHKKSSVFKEEDRYKELIRSLYNLYIKIQALPYNVATDFINMIVDYKKKNYKGKLTFNELLYKASNLVKNSEEARLHLKNKYRYFYLDESQDTDPMQIELIMYLADEETKYKDLKSWQCVKPRPGSLFIVGDPKQSIYRFRRADIRIYNQIKEVIDKNGQVVYLDINFRSSDELCKWVQSTFKKKDDKGFAFGENSSELQAGFKRILSQWDDSLDEDNREYEDVHLQGVYKYDYGENDEEYVADLIVSFLNNYIISEKIKKDGEYVNQYRPVEARDIMVLTKANEETGLYLRALKDRGIAALLAGEKSLGDTREVLNLFALIDALVNPRDNIKIVSALKNSFYLDLETIELFLEEESSLFKFVFSIDEIETIEHLSVKTAFIYLNKIVNLSRRLSPIAFIEVLIENKLGVYEVDRDYDDLELRDAKSSLGQVVEILKTRECDSVYKLLEELKILINSKVQYELPINKEEATDALRIMNIHKAKGLEAAIVILAGGDKKRYISGDSHYVEKNSKDESIGYMKYSSKMKIKGPDEDLKKERENEFKEAEQDRLLYVAATRAKSVLIVANALDEKSFLYPLSSNIDREIKLDKAIEKKDKISKITRSKIMERRLRKELQIKKEIYPSTYVLSSPSKFKSKGFYINNGEKIQAKSLKIKSAKRVKATDSIRINFGPRGITYGSIVHKAIEYLIQATNNLKDISQESIDYCARASVDRTIDNMEINKTNIGFFYPGQTMRVENIIKKQNQEGREKVLPLIKDRLYQYVKDLLKNFIDNEDIKILFQNSEKIFVELPFTIGLDDNNGELFHEILNLMGTNEIETIRKHNKAILINGVIDLLVKSKDEKWTILDYKTDRPLKKEKDISEYLKKAYSHQLEGYKLLFEEIVKDEEIKLDNLLIYSTYMDKIVEINNIKQLATNIE